MPFCRYLLSMLACLLLLTADASAQGPDDFLQSNDKIYIPVLVLATIFAGIILFLIYLDRKLRRIEKENKAGQH